MPVKGAMTQVKAQPKTPACPSKGPRRRSRRSRRHQHARQRGHDAGQGAAEDTSMPAKGARRRSRRSRRHQYAHKRAMTRVKAQPKTPVCPSKAPDAGRGAAEDTKVPAKGVGRRSRRSRRHQSARQRCWTPVKAQPKTPKCPPKGFDAGRGAAEDTSVHRVGPSGVVSALARVLRFG